MQIQIFTAEARKTVANLAKAAAAAAVPRTAAMKAVMRVQTQLGARNSGVRRF